MKGQYQWSDTRGTPIPIEDKNRGFSRGGSLTQSVGS